MIAITCRAASSRPTWSARAGLGGKGTLTRRPGTAGQVIAIILGKEGYAYIIGLVKDTNHPARAFNKRVGMRLKNWFPGLVAYELTREQRSEEHTSELQS